jgi:hypothetical protein
MESTRKKDKKKGWYTYFWTIDVNKALKVSETVKKQEIDNFQHMLKSREMKNFYFCEADSIEMNEETAMNHDFSCPECGQLLQPVPREKKIKEITLRIDAFNKRLAIINEELERFKPKVIKNVEKKKKGKKAKKPAGKKAVEKTTVKKKAAPKKTAKPVKKIIAKKKAVPSKKPKKKKK